LSVAGEKRGHRLESMEGGKKSEMKKKICLL